jgi:hypothetical protein
MFSCFCGNRRARAGRLIPSLLLVCVLVALTCPQTCAESASPKAPNFIVIFADDK